MSAIALEDGSGLSGYLDGNWSLVIAGPRKRLKRNAGPRAYNNFGTAVSTLVMVLR
jgi:hypothetical protein